MKKKLSSCCEIQLSFFFEEIEVHKKMENCKENEFVNFLKILWLFCCSKDFCQKFPRSIACISKILKKAFIRQPLTLSI